MFFPSHCSSGHVGCSFENPAKILTAKNWDIFAQYQQFIAEQRQKKNFMGLVFLKLRLQFWQPCWKFPPKGPIVLAQCAKIVKKINWKLFSPIHCSSGHVGCSFKNHVTTFKQKGQNFCSTWTVHERRVSKKWFTSKSTSWHVNCTFATMPRSLHQMAKKFYLNVRR